MTQSIPCFAKLENDFLLKGVSYADDSHPTYALENKLDYQTPSFKLESRFFIDSGPLGSWSLDAPRVAYYLNYSSSPQDLFWVGRENPLALSRGEEISPYTAFASEWVQNQVNALNPYVSGWIGLGAQKQFFNQLTFMAAYSPLFVPTFSPGLGINKRGELNPARFARTPPTTVETGGVILPIRYQIQMDQLSELLLQHQVFLGTVYEPASFRFEAFAYSAPKVAPLTSTDAGLSVDDDTVNAKVKVKPLFPREHWVGFSAQAKEFSAQPRLEFKQSLTHGNTNFISLWGNFSIQKNQNIELGVLSRFNQSPFDYPDVSDLFLMIKAPLQIYKNILYTHTLQTTLRATKKSFYWLQQLDYIFMKSSTLGQLGLLAELGILGGEDNSYFGEWRAHDFISLGVKWFL